MELVIEVVLFIMRFEGVKGEERFSDLGREFRGGWFGRNFDCGWRDTVNLS